MASQDKEGKILILATEHCAYPGANSVGQAHSSYPANTYILRVPSPVLFPESFYLDCFQKGIGGHHHHVLRHGMPLSRGLRGPGQKDRPSLWFDEGKRSGHSPAPADGHLYGL